MASSTSLSSNTQYHKVGFESKPPIVCLKFDAKRKKASPHLIFTHGAGGDLESSVIRNFSNGFSSELPITCFKGNINLASRVKMFEAVIKDAKCQTCNCLGGRSMGARAAVMAASKTATTHLVLASYPLHTNKQLRDQILLAIPPSVKVLFISGANDNLCQLDRLEEVRHKMKCKTWCIVIDNADHGMNLRPKEATDSVGYLAGVIAAKWIQTNTLDHTEGRITWIEAESRPRWSEWTASRVAASSETAIKAIPKKRREASSTHGNDRIVKKVRRTR